MAELMILSALLASAAAGIYDLRTTEVPEDIPALMIASGVFYWFIHALALGDFYPLFISLSVGTLLLAASLLLYRKGQWGEADAWILAGIAYMIPLHNGIFMLPFMLNFFIVGAAYTIVYTIILGLLHRSVFRHFARDMAANARVLILPAALLIAAAAFSALGAPAEILLRFSVMLALLLVFWRYAKVVEARVFRRRISAKNLKVGDVVEGMIWRGLKKEEISEIRRKRRYVVVKEGVRFVPVFPIALAVTLLYGNLLLLFI